MDYQVSLINLSNPGVWAEREIAYIHLGLAYLASFLRKEKIPVEIYDGDFLQLKNKEIMRKIKESQPDLVGFTATAFTINNVYEVIRGIKKENHHPVIVLGGHQATFAAKDILNENKFIDFIIYGEGEITFSELIKKLANNKEIIDINGIYHKVNDQIKKTPPRELIEDLDMLPFPARDIFDDCLKGNKEFILNVISSRGCPGRCSFCSVSQFYSLSKGLLWRGRSPEKFVDEIEILIQKYGNNLIDISDDNFIGFKNKGKKRVKEICREIIDRGLKIKFSISSRADIFNKDEDDLVKLLKEAGLISIHLGFEAGCQSMLNLYNKKINVNQLIQAYEIFQQNNISCSQGNFIMFNPYTTFKTLKQNIELFFRVDQVLFYELSSILYLFPGISLIDKVRKDNLLRKNFNHSNTLAYNFLDPKIEILAKFLYESRKNFYFVDATVGKIDSVLNIYDYDFLPLLNGKIEHIYLANKRKILTYKKNIQNSLQEFIKTCIDFLEVNDNIEYNSIVKDLNIIKLKSIKICEENKNKIETLAYEIYQLINNFFK
ncbi:MAG: B12-binding domain-containing radical SAM protein [Promethearchaeota archaeon]